MYPQTRRGFLAKSVVVFSATAIRPDLSGVASANEIETVTHDIKITEFSYIPQSLIVKPGDTVIWTNTDIVAHTATASDKSWDTGIIDSNESKELVITKDMNGDYFCRFHPHMSAKIEITN